MEVQEETVRCITAPSVLLGAYILDTGDIAQVTSSVSQQASKLLLQNTIRYYEANFTINYTVQRSISRAG